MSNAPVSTEELLKKYLSTNKILIADGSKMSRDAVFRIICELGAHALNVNRVETYEEAFNDIKDRKPSIVLSEFDLGKRTGLELMQSLREQVPDSKKSLFVLITGNASQSTVAQAAEEDVDTFVLKPFSATSLRAILVKAIILKISPPGYLKEIEKGKTLLFETKLDEAKAAFDAAVALDPKPALAHFYLGQVELMREALDKASGSYKKGLDCNKIHYKCLVGLYELLMKQKNYD